MSRKVQHGLLQEAKRNKKDEFYTQLVDIENELQYYSGYFKDKIVLCNCDDPRISNFCKYFVLNFHNLGIKKIICTSYSKNESHGYYYEFDGQGNPNDRTIIKMTHNGDFRNKESLSLLKHADIIVTNPPFSLFREYIQQIADNNKKFLVIGNINAITYKNVFSLIQANRAWLGVNFGRGISGFIVPKEYELYGTETKIDSCGNRIIAPNNCLWLTNLENSIRRTDLVLSKRYYGNESSYPRYDNYDGINVNRTNDIPMDYYGNMGVPITFLHKFNPNQFEIIRFRKGDDGKDLSINGKCPYFRIIIRRKEQSQCLSEYVSNHNLSLQQQSLFTAKDFSV